MKKHRPGSEEYKLFDEENSFLVKWRLTGAMQKLHNLMAGSEGVYKEGNSSYSSLVASSQRKNCLNLVRFCGM